MTVINRKQRQCTHVGLLSWLPTYYADRFGVEMSGLGQYTVLPYVLQIGTSIFAGGVADKLITKGEWRVLDVRKFLQTTGASHVMPLRIPPCLIMI
jgi:hypothetical protein